MSRTTLIVILLVAVLVIMALAGWRVTESTLGTPEKFAAMGTVVAVLGVIVTVVVLFVPSDVSDHNSASPSPSPGDTETFLHDPTQGGSTPTTASSGQAHETATNGSTRTPTGIWQTAPRKDFSEAHIRATRDAYVGLCMAVVGGAVETDTCSETSNQLWHTTSRGEIVTSSGQCLTAGADHGGVKMTVSACDRSSGQQWRFTNGRITSGRLELTIYGPYQDPGHPIQTWDTSQDPKPAPEMYWNLS